MTGRKAHQASDKAVVSQRSPTNGSADVVVGPLWAVGWLFTHRLRSIGLVAGTASLSALA